MEYLYLLIIIIISLIIKAMIKFLILVKSIKRK